MMPEKTLAYQLIEKFQDDREKLGRYVALAELCPLPAFIVGHDKLTVIFVNAAYRTLTGRHLHELQSGAWIDLVIHPEDRAVVANRWRLFKETGTIEPHRHRYISVDGTVTDAVTLLERVEGNGFVGFVLPQCGATIECPVARIYKLASPEGLSPST